MEKIAEKIDSESPQEKIEIGKNLHHAPQMINGRPLSPITAKILNDFQNLGEIKLGNSHPIYSQNFLESSITPAQDKTKKITFKNLALLINVVII